MEVLIPVLLIGFVCACIVLWLSIGWWFGEQRNRPQAGFWLGLFLGPFGWLLTLLLPDGKAGQAVAPGAAQTIPGRCPTCGGALVGYFPKCPHCASDVFWAGGLPMRTAQEAADEQARQERLAAEQEAQKRERAAAQEEEWKRLAAEREEWRKRSAAEREEWQKRRAAEREEARRRWKERKQRWNVAARTGATAAVSGLVSGARWLAQATDKALRGLARRRREARTRAVLVSTRRWVRKANHVLRGWSNRLRTLNEAGMRRCLWVALAVLMIPVTAAGALVVKGAIGKYQESCREQERQEREHEKQELAQQRRNDNLADRETRLAVLGIRRSESPVFWTDDLNEGIAQLTERIQRNPEDAKSYRTRGVCRCAAGDWGPAIADLTEAMRVDPEMKDAPVHRCRGFARCVLGRWEPAIADLSEAVRLDPKDARAYAFRSAAHARKGEVQTAQRDHENAKGLGFRPDEFAIVAEVLE